jgi:hypothetical protein
MFDRHANQLSIEAVSDCMVSNASRGAWSQTDPDLITIERSGSFVERSTEKIFLLISHDTQNMGTNDFSE